MGGKNPNECLGFADINKFGLVL